MDLEMTDVADEEILKLSKSIGNDIRELGIYLGFTVDEVASYDDANRVNLTKNDGTYQMLTSWNRREEATRGTLCAALRKANRGKLARRLEGKVICKQGATLNPGQPAQQSTSWPTLSPSTPLTTPTCTTSAFPVEETNPPIESVTQDKAPIEHKPDGFFNSRTIAAAKPHPSQCDQNSCLMTEPQSVRLVNNNNNTNLSENQRIQCGSRINLHNNKHLFSKISYEAEAIVICLDVGPSMNQAPPGHCTTLEMACDVITLILGRKVFAESKDEIALLLFGTPGTANPLSDAGYKNITVDRPFKVVDFDLIRHIKNNVQPSQISGDCISALMVAIDMICKAKEVTKCKKHRIILFSDLGGECGKDKLDQVIAKIKQLKTELNVIGLQFEDDEGAEEGHDGPFTSHKGAQKEKTPQQRAGERLIKDILHQVKGANYTFQEVIPLVTMFEKKAVRPMPWKVNLEIGSQLKIPVSGYCWVKVESSKSFVSAYQKGLCPKNTPRTIPSQYLNSNEETEVQEDSSKLTQQKSLDKDYTPESVASQHLNDNEETKVEKDDIVEGYYFGKDFIPISEKNKSNMAYKKPGKVLQVLMFTEETDIKSHQQVGNSVHLFVPQPDDRAAAMAFSALTRALHETDSVAIVRYAYNARSNPRIGYLAPHIEATYEMSSCLRLMV